jgi:hypothetical protein
MSVQRAKCERGGALVRLRLLLLAATCPIAVLEAGSTREPAIVLGTPQSTYRQREALELRIEYRNTDEKPLLLRCGTSAGDHRLLLDYKRPKGSWRRFVGFADPPSLGHAELLRPPALIPPSGAITRTISVVVDSKPDRFVLEEPGTYAFRVRCVDRRQEPVLDVTSNVLTVQVEQSQPGDAAIAAEYDQQLGQLAQFRKDSLWEPEERLVKRAEAFLDKYPGEPQTKGLKLGLARYLHRSLQRGSASDEHKALYHRLTDDGSAEESLDSVLIPGQ